jgi:hypothetical protein
MDDRVDPEIPRLAGGVISAGVIDQITSTTSSGISPCYSRVFDALYAGITTMIFFS